MFKRISIILLGGMLLLSACGPQGTPTMAPADINNTAVAAAFTIVAQTQAAIPTNTLIPPTETPSPTPLPTFTLPPSPTLEQFLSPPTPTQAVASDPNSCLKPLNVGEAGPLKKVRFENVSDGDINLSVNLWTPNAFGQCGAIQYIIKKNGTVTTTIPNGQYYGWAYITHKDGSTSNASGNWVMNVGYGDLVVVKVGNEVIRGY